MITSKNLFAAIFIIFIVFVFIPSNSADRMSYDDYQRARNKLFNDEQWKAIGLKLTLNSRESLANNIIMKAKTEEIDRGFLHPELFAPGQHFFRVLDLINQSRVFQFLKFMPKGGCLHIHDTTLASTNSIINLTYTPNLWQCHSSDPDGVSFKFSRVQPTAVAGCEWKLVSEERKKSGEDAFNANIRKYLSVYTNDPEKDIKNVNEGWGKAIPVFLRLEQLVTFEPVYKKYMQIVLQEFFEDGVQYLELRGTLPSLYDLDGKTYTKNDFIDKTIEVVEEFKKANPEFIGVKFIYAPPRQVNDTTFATYMTTIQALKTKYPEFVVGFDLVGQEDPGRPLKDFIKPLLQLPSNINFYFHAGETAWNGRSTDENILDAVTLRAKRCGHCFAVLKHVEALRVIKQKGIAIEVSAISNQMSTFVHDQRNHPASFLFAHGYPVVITSDDPSLWGALPLSHDMYIAFMAYTSAYGDLRTLKQLAINSIAYSSLNNDEKIVAFSKWEPKWHEFVESVIQNGNNI